MQAAAPLTLFDFPHLKFSMRMDVAPEVGGQRVGEVCVRSEPTFNAFGQIVDKVVCQNDDDTVQRKSTYIDKRLDSAAAKNPGNSWMCNRNEDRWVCTQPGNPRRSDCMHSLSNPGCITCGALPRLDESIPDLSFEDIDDSFDLSAEFEKIE